MDNASRLTKGMVSHEGHRSYIRPQSLTSRPNESPKDMNFDIDNEKISYSQTEICDPLPTPPKFPKIDMVDWANTQPAALKSLLSVATKRPEKRHARHDPNALHQVGSTTVEPPPARSRPLRRTNSSARARLGPMAASTSFSLPPVPDGDFWNKDRNAVLAACQNVSERMDESVLLVAQTLEAAPVKHKLNAHHVNDVTKGRKAPYSVAHGREWVSRWDKGKQRASPDPDPKPLGVGPRRSVSAPIYEGQQARSSRAASIEPTISETSIDVDMYDITLPLFDTPLPKRNHTTFSRTTSSSSTSSSSTDTSSPVTPISIAIATSRPSIQLHPLLTQKHPPKHTTSNTNLKASSPLRQLAKPSAPPPSLSQSTRPRVLGMRRAHAGPVNAHHVLPTKQKAFRPPLLSQAPPTPRAAATPPPREKDNFDSNDSDRSTLSMSRSPSPGVDCEADTSFGDLSLGMDIEELELTMRQYD